MVAYLVPADVRNALGGTDAGTGTAAMLEDSQLLAAITRASARVSASTGTTYTDDSGNPVNVPQLVTSLTMALAKFYATLTYRKGKDLSQFDPVYLDYQDAVATLNAIANGTIDVDPTPPDEGVDGTGHVVNTLPPIFSGRDSHTRLGARTIEPDGPWPGWRQGWNGW